VSESTGKPPVDFLEFMNKYALFLDSFGPSGEYWAMLEESPGGDGRPTTYTLKNVHGDGPGHFKIYWCQYKKDAVFTVSLHKAAYVMFTPKMNGCTFAVGMPTPEGNIIVGHANVHDSMDTELKSINDEMEAKGTSFDRIMELNNIRLDLIRGRQLEMLSGAFQKGEAPVDVKKKLDSTNASYSTSSSGIITFGIRDESSTSNKWRFYFQTKNSGNKVTGVHKIKK
jgi:hypothetical protein